MTLTVDRVPNNLPIQLTSFVGRTAELDAVTELLGSARLVTLTGPGGAGKTRLAWQVAQGADRFPDGVWWVELAGVTDGAGVAEVAAAAVGVLVDRARGPLRSIAAHLGGRQALIGLDNAEHLLDDVAALAETLLRAGPDLTLLVTSREPLGLPGEVVFRVPPLDDKDAIRLFVDRARQVRPSFTLDPDGELAVRSIVLHLDGIPLALELAAAWLGTLTPQQILAGLDDRFRLLVRGPRGAQRRHQTLAASMGWSHALLNPFDRLVFRRLAVFAGTFGLEAAGAIGATEPADSGEILAAVGRLVDKSLIVAEAHDGQARYRMLETIRAYAAARLAESGEEAAVRDVHLAWCVAFAERTDAQREWDPGGSQQALRHEYDNLRVALARGLAAHDPAAGRRLAASLAWFWHLDRRGREGIADLRRAIERTPDDRSRLQARLLTGLALVADTADPLDLEYDAATRALELATVAGDDGLRALCLSLKAVGAFYTDFDEAWALCERAVDAATAGRNEFARAGARALQAIILHLRDRHTEADALFDDVLPVLLRLHRGVAATVLGYQAGGALATGDVPRARRLAEDAVRVAEPLGDYLRVGMARSVLAVIHASAGDLGAADAAIGPIVRLVEAAEDEIVVTGLATAMGQLALRAGDPERACAWFERDARSTDRGMETWVAGQALAGLGAALALRGRRTEAAAALEHALTVANRLGMPRVRAEALMAQAELAATDPQGIDRALDLAHGALAERAEHDLRADQLASLDGIVRLGAIRKPTRDDLRLLAATDAARDVLGMPRSAGETASVDAARARLRDVLGDQAFAAASAEGAALALADAVAYARRTRGTRGRPATGWSSLTPTELEVATLVADGLSNPDIAGRLFMSRSTVKTHLSHIFTKLEITNRTELATLAGARRGQPTA